MTKGIAAPLEAIAPYSEGRWEALMNEEWKLEGIKAGKHKEEESATTHSAFHRKLDTSVTIRA